MQRLLLLTAVLGVTLIGLGCKHIAGQCDCQNDPSNAMVNTGGPGVAYPTLGQPISSTAVPEKMPAPAEKMPMPMGK